MLRTKTVPLIALVLAIAAIGTTLLLQRQASEARGSERDLQAVRLNLTNLQTLPFQAFPGTGGVPALALVQIVEAKRVIAEKLDALRSGSPPATLDRLEAALRANESSLDRIYDLGIATSQDDATANSSASPLSLSPELTKLATEAATTNDRAVSMIKEISGEYRDRASSADRVATFGGGAVILLLFAAFVFYYQRSVRVALENRRILVRTREESLTDALTGLLNRRALINDLDAGVAQVCSEGDESEGGGELMLSLFDLDGFKQYNDTFGHPAGDALLRRLGRRLEAAVGAATVYRMGGDEFCLLARVSRGDAAAQIAELGVVALTERGAGFEIGCCQGSALIPSEAGDAESALSLADERMYSQKAEGTSASRQSSDVLQRVLVEKSASLSEHLSGVGALAEPTALALGLSEATAARVKMAAELHDVGKTGIPDAILDKPDPLDHDEMVFMQRHTLIGERILRAAPSLVPAAGFVRSHHERMDGTGYPDGLRGESIPIGARIIFACDAFNAMTSDRPYRKAIPVKDALAELRRCSGTQFDPRVVEALAAQIEGGASVEPTPQPIPV